MGCVWWAIKCEDVCYRMMQRFELVEAFEFGSTPLALTENILSSMPLSMPLVVLQVDGTTRRTSAPSERGIDGLRHLTRIFLIDADCVNPEPVISSLPCLGAEVHSFLESKRRCEQIR